jgi:UDP-N-acetylglucosamine diphosphorylase / glucose-1-phosphate thymidylyltransferase / UDP-N-acetylgalactosamine diphosphorylase / glucosamine-1-phosphate N-acetyltransferase / galactosamine-1-phosphate N-acetyltransferase
VIQQAVILAAGRGSRLGSLTRDRSKAMLPVLGKPIVVRVMDRLREAGIKNFVVVLGEHEGGVAGYLSSSWYPDTKVKYALQITPTGAVDALQLAAPHITGPFVLASVDNVTSLDHVQSLVRCYQQHPDTLATLSLIAASADEIRQSSGVVLDGNRITAIEDQGGSLASFMLYAFSKDILTYLPRVKVSPRGERELISAIQFGLTEGKHVSYVIAEWRQHLAREWDLLAINKRLLQEGRDTHILSEIPNTVRIISPVRIDPNVSVGQNARIGPNVYLETGSTVGQGATIEDSMVLTGAIVPAGQRVNGQIVDRHGRISEETS